MKESPGDGGRAEDRYFKNSLAIFSFEYFFQIESSGTRIVIFFDQSFFKVSQLFLHFADAYF